MADDEVQTRERSATVTGTIDDVKTELHPFKLVESGRTSSDSALATTKQPADAPANDEADAGPMDDAERAIAAAKALRVEKEAENAAVQPQVDVTASENAPADHTSQSKGKGEANSNAATSSAPTSSAASEAQTTHDGGGTVKKPIQASASTAAITGKGAQVDPWLQKPVADDDALPVPPGSSKRDSRSRFFAFPIGRSEPVATRVSRWMPFDSLSDARAASRRASAEWWQMPELQGSAAAAAAANSTGAAESKNLAPTNPFAADVQKQEQQGEMPASSTEEQPKKAVSSISEEPEEPAASEAAPAEDGSKKEPEITPAEDGGAAEGAGRSKTAGKDTRFLCAQKQSDTRCGFEGRF